MKVTADISQARAQVARLNALFRGVQHFAAPGVGTGFAMHASGVRNSPGGLAIVGEEGPELMNVPRGADIYSHAESRRMASSLSGGRGGGGNGPTLVQLVLPNGRVLLQALLDEQTAQGGSLPMLRTA